MSVNKKSVKYKRSVNKSRLNIKKKSVNKKSVKYKRSVNKSQLNIKGR